MPVVVIISWEWSRRDSHSGTSVPEVLVYQFTAAWTVDSRMGLVLFWMSLTTHMVVKALALSTRDQTCSPPLFFSSLRVLLAFGILPFHMKDCTLFSMHHDAGSHSGNMPAWYQTSERHMILATITLSMGMKRVCCPRH
jgi:hypothetical protein